MLLFFQTLTITKLMLGSLQSTEEAGTKQFSREQSDFCVSGNPAASVIMGLGVLANKAPESGLFY